MIRGRFLPVCPQRSHLRRLFFSAAAALVCSLGYLASAADVVWTPQPGFLLFGVWSSSDGFNWSTGTAPGNGDTAIFPANFTPFPSGIFPHPIGLRPDGSEVLLLGNGVPPVAGNLVFLNSWQLTQLGGFRNVGLVLTNGGVTVSAGHTAIIDANILVAKGQVVVPGFSDPNSPPGLLTKLGQGTLLLERSVVGNILVAEGTLGGNFTVFGDLTNQTILAPGNSPGKIQVNGNFTQTHSGHLQIQIASPADFDQLQISKKAHLAGALDVELLNGYLPKKGQEFHFLSAGDGISGRFDEVNAPVWDDLTLRPIYQGDRVYFKTVIDSFEALGGLTPNQQAVAHVLDGIIGDSRADKLLNYLYDCDFDQLPRDLDRLAPEELTSIFTLGVSYSTVQSLNIQRRTDDLRSGSSGFSAANFAINGHGPSYSGAFGSAGPVGDDGKEIKESKEVAPAGNRWGAFLSGTGEWVSVGNTDNARGYDLASGGFTLGVDYKISPHLALGLAAGYTGATADLVDRGRVWVNGGKLGLYATAFTGGWYADTAVFGGYNSYDTRRSALRGEARGDTDSGELNVLFATGYDFKKGPLTFGPTASFNYTYLGLDSFTEHGSLAPLDIHGGKGESLRTALGFKVSYECKCGNVMIKPELRAAWQHEFGDSVYNLTSSFANGAGDSFTVAGPRIGRDGALLGIGLAIQLNECCSTYLYYDGELGRTNYHAANVTGGFRLAF